MGGSQRPAESGKVHSRILKMTLCVPESVAYWKAPVVPGTASERARFAFDGHWFGAKSEARVRTLISHLDLRFDAYPSALAALRFWQPPSDVAPWICHLHTQLSDPVYRRFSGEYLPERLAKGYSTVDRDAVARWVDEHWAGRWAPVTCVKFGGNMLATAFETGLLTDGKDPRKLTAPRVPVVALEYLLYLLRETTVEGGLLDSPYFRSVAPDESSQSYALGALRAVRLKSLGDVREFDWTYPDLMSWASAQKEAA